MNELNLSIPNAYVYSHEKTYCFTVNEQIHFQIVSWNNEKGYAFLSHPCFCYGLLCKDLRSKYGDIKEEPLDLLLSEKRIAFLNKIIADEDFSSCKLCPKYIMRENGGFWDKADFEYLYKREFGTKMYDMFNNKKLSSVYPKGMTLNLGAGCNLKCKTCRNEFITQTFNITDDDMKQFVFIAKHVSSLTLGGDGEFCMNPNYIKLLQQDLTSDSTLNDIIILTNGTMFNENAWNKIPDNSKKLITELKISIDAATPETYANIRGPVGWNMLMKNMPFIQRIKEENDMLLSTTFTISKYNVQDVFKFYEFAKRLGFDMVMFQFARSIFHPETGDDSSYIISGDEHDEIVAKLCELRDREGFRSLLVE